MLAERPHPVAVPRRHEVERLLGRVEHARTLQMNVEDREIDEPRLLPVGNIRDGAREILLARLGADRQNLARLDVGAESHHQLGQASDGL